MNEKLTRRAFLGVAGSAALTLAACGGNGGGAPAPEGGSEGGEPEPEPSAESTTGGATLTVGSSWEDVGLDSAEDLDDLDSLLDRIAKLGRDGKENGDE